MDTRGSNPAGALEHVLTVVLKNPSSSDPVLAGPFRKAMVAAGVQDIGDLIIRVRGDKDFLDYQRQN